MCVRSMFTQWIFPTWNGTETTVWPKITTSHIRMVCWGKKCTVAWNWPFLRFVSCIYLLSCVSYEIRFSWIRFSWTTSKPSQSSYQVNCAQSMFQFRFLAHIHAISRSIRTFKWLSITAQIKILRASTTDYLSH